MSYPIRKSSPAVGRTSRAASCSSNTCSTRSAPTTPLEAGSSARRSSLTSHSTSTSQPGGSTGACPSSQQPTDLKVGSTAEKSTRRRSRNTRWLPTKSKTLSWVFPAQRRRPRPSCWRKTTGDSVGRSITTRSTAGISTPSLNRSTTQSASSSPARKAWSAPVRLAEPGPLWIATARTPMPESHSCANLACSMEQQKTSVRVPVWACQPSHSFSMRRVVAAACASSSGSKRRLPQGRFV